MTCQTQDQACQTKEQSSCGCGCPVKVYLANLAVWNAKLHNLHWNVVGSTFVQVHEYTESLYDKVLEQYDEVAEAIKMRNGFPPVRLTDYLKAATIEELDSRAYPVDEVLEIVEADMAKMQELAKQIRDGADERGDYLLVSQFEDYLADYAKSMWFIRSIRTK